MRLGITDARRSVFRLYERKNRGALDEVEGQLLAMLENVRDLTLEAAE